MAAGPNPVDLVEAARGNQPKFEQISLQDEKKNPYGGELTRHESDSESDSTLVGPNGEHYPTVKETETLRHVHGKIPWTAYTIGFVELCERFSYYGTTAVFVNFIQQPLPQGSTTGSAGTNGQPGALGLGQRASTGLTLFNSFWAYVMPLLGAYMADTYWGRYMTILVAIGIAIVGHLVLIISTLPAVIAHPHGAIVAFAIGLVIFGVGVGGFKSNISPLIAEQYEHEHPRSTIKVLKDGERVIEDTTMTISRIYMYFYLMINIGALIGQIAMVYAEKYVGYWLAFTLPTLMFCCCPIVMFVCRNKYVKRPPTGSVLAKASHLWVLAMKGRWSINPVRTFKNMQSGDFWERVKPSQVQSKPKWMTFDDAWVDEVARGLRACTVFLWFPIYWLAYNQMLNNLVSQAAVLELHGVPNDVVNNIDPFALIIFIPIVDRFLYPFLAKIHLRFTPIRKITLGFYLGSASMVVAAIIQHFIYVKSPCGNHANSCETAAGNTIPAPFSVWVQIPAYLLIALSEIFASITGLEYAFTKAPKNMRSLVMSVFLFMTAFSSAISQAFVSLSADPLLVWNYTTVAIIAFIGGTSFWFCFRNLDKQEEALNALPESTYKGREKTGIINLEEAQAELRNSRTAGNLSMAGTRT